MKKHKGNLNEIFKRAAKVGNLKTVKDMLKNERVRPNCSKDYAIRWAAANGHLDVVTLLMDDERVDFTTAHNKPFQLACSGGHRDVVQYMLRNRRIKPDDAGNVAFSMAAKNGNLDILKDLVRDGRANPGANSNDAFLWAVINNHIGTVNYLLSLSSVNPTDRHNTAFIQAARRGHVEMIQLLLRDKRVDPTAQKHKALTLAAENGKTEIVKLLLKLEAFDKSDATPLHKSISNGHTSVVRILLAHRRLSPSNLMLISAIRQENSAIVEALIHDERVDLTFNSSQCLQEAVEREHKEIVEFLLGDEAVRASVFVSGALRVALQQRNFHIVNLLLNTLPEERTLRLRDYLYSALNQRPLSYELLRVLLARCKLDSKEDSHILSRLVPTLDLPLFNLFLHDGQLDPTYRGNKLLIKIASSTTSPDIFKSIFDDKRIDPLAIDPNHYEFAWGTGGVKLQKILWCHGIAPHTSEQWEVASTWRWDKTSLKYFPQALKRGIRALLLCLKRLRVSNFFRDLLDRIIHYMVQPPCEIKTITNLGENYRVKK